MRQIQLCLVCSQAPCWLYGAIYCIATTACFPSSAPPPLPPCPPPPSLLPPNPSPLSSNKPTQPSTHPRSLPTSSLQRKAVAQYHLIEAVCCSGASVDSYYLGGYSASQVTAPGRLTIPQMNASLVSGRLYAQFTMQLTQGAADLAAGVPIM